MRSVIHRLRGVSHRRRKARKPAFVELIAPPSAMLRECLIEFESVCGGKVRILWKAAAPPDWMSLQRAFRILVMRDSVLSGVRASWRDCSVTLARNLELPAYHSFSQISVTLGASHASGSGGNLFRLVCLRYGVQRMRELSTMVGTRAIGSSSRDSGARRALPPLVRCSLVRNRHCSPADAL